MPFGAEHPQGMEFFQNTHPTNTQDLDGLLNFASISTSNYQAVWKTQHLNKEAAVTQTFPSSIDNLGLACLNLIPSWDEQFSTQQTNHNAIVLPYRSAPSLESWGSKKGRSSLFFCSLEFTPHARYVRSFLSNGRE